MNLFQPIEIEIKTGWTQEELIGRFREKPITKKEILPSDEFEIGASLFGYNALSHVKGKIGKFEDWTVVSFKIYPSMFLNIFTIIWLGFTSSAILVGIIASLINWEYRGELTMLLIFWVMGLVISHLSFRSSAAAREESIRQTIRYKD